VLAAPATPPVAPPIIAPGTHPTPSRGAVAAAPIPQPTAAPPTAPPVVLAAGSGVQLAHASAKAEKSKPFIMISPMSCKPLAQNTRRSFAFLGRACAS